ADAAGDALTRLIARRGTSLLGIYGNADAFADLHRIAERFVDWDGAFQTWLVEHFHLVRRTLGIDKTVRALDGFPTVALAARMTKPLFSELWKVRVEMAQAWNRDGGFAPGATRVTMPETRIPDTRSRVATGSRPPFGESTVRDEFPLLAQCVYLNSNST